MQKLGLAGLLGLVAGILIASIAETMRPTVPGARRVSRRLSVPALGQLSGGDLNGGSTPALGELALRCRLAAAHADLRTIALVDVDGKRDLAALAAALTQSLQVSSPGGGSADVGSGRSGLAGRANGSQHWTTPRSEPTLAGVAPSVMVKARSAVTGNPGLQVYPLGQMTWVTGATQVGIVVLSGPVGGCPASGPGRLVQVVRLADRRGRRHPQDARRRRRAQPRSPGEAGADDASASVPFARAEIVPEAQQAALDVLRSGWITMGPETAEFEEELAATWAPHVVAVASCTQALELACGPCACRRRTRPDPEPDLLWCGRRIVHAGYRPVLLDIDEQPCPVRKTVATPWPGPGSRPPWWSAPRRLPGRPHRPRRRGRPAERADRGRRRPWTGRPGRPRRGSDRAVRDLPELLRDQEPADR